MEEFVERQRKFQTNGMRRPARILLCGGGRERVSQQVLVAGVLQGRDRGKERLAPFAR